MQCVKYSGSGNDFIIFTSSKKDCGTRANLARNICHRHNGIGADGMVVIIPAKNKEYSYEWEFYNADGSKAMCGNASRCAGHYAFENKIAPAKHRFYNGKDMIDIVVESNLVQSDLGEYKILQENIEIENPYGVDSFSLIDTGVPHLVGFTKQDLPQFKDELMQELRMKYNANVNLAHINSDKSISYITYERGVEDITLACGTGAAAIFINAFKEGKCKSCATLIPPSKENLTLKLDSNNHILFSGVVRKIAECNYLLS